jgi:hypothetical protein
VPLRASHFRKVTNTSVCFKPNGTRLLLAVAGQGTTGTHGVFKYYAISD